MRYYAALPYSTIELYLKASIAYQYCTQAIIFSYVKADAGKETLLQSFDDGVQMFANSIC